MMNHGMMNGGMMWGMGALGLVGITVAILLLVALIKYVFFR
jgi:hypothetical protein